MKCKRLEGPRNEEADKLEQTTGRKRFCRQVTTVQLEGHHHHHQQQQEEEEGSVLSAKATSEQQQLLLLLQPDRTIHPSVDLCPSSIATTAAKEFSITSGATITPEHSMIDLQEPSPYRQLQQLMMQRRVSTFVDEEVEQEAATTTPNAVVTTTPFSMLASSESSIDDGSDTATTTTITAKPHTITRTDLPPAPDSQPFGKHLLSTKVLTFVAVLFSSCFAGLSLLQWSQAQIRTTPSSPSPSPPQQDSIYVPGGGFSGFWFTIGRIQSIPEPETKQFHCYSAGCLGVVAALGNHSFQHITDIAYGIQQMWKNGTLHQYDVVSDFVEKLVPLDNNINEDEEFPIEHLANINIITTVKRGWAGLKASIRTPQSLHELREMLVQTTYIPLATGNRLWHVDSKTGIYHMDGAFSIPDHPKCQHRLGLPMRWDLCANTLNMNLPLELVKKFWKDGLAYGL